MIQKITSFDVTVEGHYPSKEDREYCEDGEFVDAEIARELYAALDVIWNKILSENPPDETLRVWAERAMAKARGEEETKR